MKKLLSTLCAILLLATLLGSLPVLAAGSMTASANASSVTVGATVTLTVKYNGGGSPIAGVQSTITYNAAAFEYTGCSGIEASGGAGNLRLSWYAPGGTAPSVVEYRVTFKAKAVGAGNFAVTTTEFVDDNTYASLGSPSRQVAVSCVNPTKSGNADLAYLRPSAGTLVPAFSPNVTSYTITVPYTVTSLLLTTDSKDQNAQVAVNGSSTMKVGKNTRTVTVTAPNGTTKTYTITITRSPDQSTDSTTSGGGGTTTTTRPPVEDPLKVTVDGKNMTVADSQPAITLPTGYAWEPLDMNGTMVPAAVNKDTGLTLLYLIGASAKDAHLYIYSEDGQFTPFVPLTVTPGSYALLDIPEGMTPPTGTAVADGTIGDIPVKAFIYEDTALADLMLVYAVGPTGHTGLYVYDKADGSLQQYRGLPTETAPTQPDTDKAPQEEPANGFVTFITTHRTVILICAAAAGGLALLIGAVILLIVLLRRPSNCRH
ncbi:MAG: hypothetical protein E7541_03825 [Ruminococcaceae bacterium]|nr:hypothetical protein [Oscillospiraceae bacterium]